MHGVRDCGRPCTMQKIFLQKMNFGALSLRATQKEAVIYLKVAA